MLSNILRQAIRTATPFQFPVTVPGKFMRASLPSPDTSSRRTIAVSATDASTARMNTQLTGSLSNPK